VIDPPGDMEAAAGMRQHDIQFRNLPSTPEKMNFAAAVADRRVPSVL
jgi:hypothetical protein